MSAAAQKSKAKTAKIEAAVGGAGYRLDPDWRDWRADSEEALARLALILRNEAETVRHAPIHSVPEALSL